MSHRPLLISNFTEPSSRIFNKSDWRRRHRAGRRWRQRRRSPQRPPSAGLSGGPWDYVERIEVTDRAAYEAELTAAGKELINELYEKYLDKSKTVSVWCERIEP